MKQSAVIFFSLATLAAHATAGPLALIGTAVSGITSAIGRKKGKRDVEYEDALLAVHTPEKISPEMLAALKQRGYEPPAQVLAAYKANSDTKSSGGDPIAKSYALDSIKKGYPVPASILEHMQQAGWTGPGLSPAAPAGAAAGGAGSLPKRSEYFDGYAFEARGYEEDDVDLFIRDFYEYDY